MKKLIALLSLLPLSAFAQPIARAQRGVDCVGAGTATAATCAPSPAVTSFAQLNTVPRTQIRFRPAASNTGALTLAINGLAARSIVKYVGGAAQPLAANDMRSGGSYVLEDDGTNFVVTSLLGNAAASGGGGDALTSNPLSQFAATTSAQLAAVLSNETGSGVAVFATSPILVTPNLGTPSAVVLTNATGMPWAGLTGVPLLVTAPATYANDNRVLRSDGTGRDSQASPCTVDDAGVMSCDSFVSTATGSTGYVELIQGAPPTAPAAGKKRLFWNASGVLQEINSGGTVASIGGSGGSGPSWSHSAWCSATIAPSTTAYCGQYGFSAIAEQARVPVPITATLQKLYVVVTGYNTPTVNCTVQKNGADTAITATVPNDSVNGVLVSDLVDTVSVTAGDYISLKCVTSAAGNSGYLAWSVMAY